MSESITNPNRWLDEDKPVAFDLLCTEVSEVFDLGNVCCGSCHDDWDQGYDSPMEMEGAGPEYAVWAQVCCAVQHRLQEIGVVHGGD